MKRYIIAVIFVLLLASCKPVEDAVLEYKESDFVFEVNQEDIDVSAFFDDQHTLSLNTSEIEFDVIGEYTLYVRDLDTEEVYEIPVVIQDTIAPEIVIPEDFEQHYDVGEDLDLSEIVVIDNSLEEITYTTNIHEIDMNTIGIYSLVINAQDSTGNLKTTSIEINVRFVNYPMIEIQTSNISDTSFSVEFIEEDVDGYKVSSSYRVINGGTVVQQGELTDTFNFNVSDLLQGTDYYVDMEFVYLIPGEEQEVITSRVLVRTLDVFTPIVDVTDEVVTSNSISFNVAKIDPDELLVEVTVEVLDNDGFVVLEKSIDTNPMISFTDLPYGHTYTVIVDYSYDLNNGDGLQEFTDTFYLQTIPLTMPIVAVDEVVLDENNITVFGDIIDAQNAFESLWIAIYLEDSTEHFLIYEVTVGSSGFEAGYNLNYNTEYTIELHLYHGAIEGVSTKEVAYSYTFISETIDVVNMYSETPQVEPEETFRVCFEIGNDFYHNVDEVTINDLVYGTDDISFNGDHVCVSVQAPSEMGEFEFVLNSVLLSNAYPDHPDHLALQEVDGISVMVDVVGPMPVVSYLTSNDNYTIGNDVEIVIQLDNPTELVIQSVVINGVTYDSTSFSITPNQSTITLQVSGCDHVCNIGYTLNSIDFELRVDEGYSGSYSEYKEYVHYSDSAAVAISTKTEFLDICSDNDGNYYLSNDFDFTSMTDTPLCEFNGYLDGNGFELSGLNITSGTGGIGLFNSIGDSGYIKNLVIVDAIVQMTATTQNYFGILAGSTRGYIENVDVSGEIILEDLNNSLFTNYVGGLAGLSFEGTTRNVVVDVEISINDSIRTVLTGIVFGQLTDSSLSYATADGQIQVEAAANAYIGGIVGIGVGSELYAVQSAALLYDIGNTGSVYIGGIIGRAYIIEIAQFEYNGEIEVRGGTSVVRAGGIAGDFDDSILRSGQTTGNILIYLENSQFVYVAMLCGSAPSSEVYEVLIANVVILDEVGSGSYTVEVSDVYTDEYGGPISTISNVFRNQNAGILDRTSYASVHRGADATFLEWENHDIEFYQDTLLYDVNVWDLTLPDGEYIVHFK